MKILISLVLTALVSPLLAAGWGIAPDGTSWNGWSPWFMYAPTLTFKAADGVNAYHSEVMDDYHRIFCVTTEQSVVDLDCLWSRLPVGYVTVVCRGVRDDGSSVETGRRTFWKKPAFSGCYEPAAMSYSLAKARILDNFLGLPRTRHMIATGEIDKSYYLSGYPTKMLAAEIDGLVEAYKGLDDNPNNDGRKSELLAFCRKAADCLIAGSVPAGKVLEYFPITYAAEGSEYGRFKGQQDWIMLVYPPQAASAYLRLYGVTKELKYLEAAERIGRTLLKTQGSDGTWPLRQNAITGEVVGKNRLLPFETMQMLEDLYVATEKKPYREAADRAFAYVEKGPARNWAWEGQFEDGRVIDDPYENLSNFPANQMIMYLLRRFPGDAVRIAQAEELMAFVEDQFIHWRPPYEGNRHLEDQGVDDGSWAWWCRPYSRWMSPCAVEQYICCVPVDASAAKCINALLAVWWMTGKNVYLAKARALGDAQTRMIEKDGFINTWSIRNVERNDDRYHTWDNCTVETMTALSRLAKAVDGE